MPITPSRNAPARNSGTRKIRILADKGLDQCQRGAADHELGDQRGGGEQHADRIVDVGDAPGKEDRQSDAGVGKQLQTRCPFEQREVPARVLEDHRLVDHRQLEVRRRVVDRHACVFRERHHREGHAGERKARVDRGFLRADGLDDVRQRSRLRQESRGEQHHQQRRLGEEPDQHFAARAQRSEGRADVHRRQRDESPGKRKNADQRDCISRGGERKIGRQRRHDAARQNHCSKDHVGSDAEQWTGVLGDDRLLPEQLVQRAVGQQQRWRALVLQPRAALVDPSGQQRRAEHRDQDHQQLGSDAVQAHRNTSTSITSKVTKLYIR